MSDTLDEIVPVGSVVSTLAWWTAPERSEPAAYATLRKAQKNSGGGYITVEVGLRRPDGRLGRLVGAVSSVDNIVPSSPRQDRGVVPAEGAVVVDVLRRDGPSGRYGSKEVSEQARIEEAYAEIIFRNPTGGQFVLVPRTMHPMQR